MVVYVAPVIYFRHFECSVSVHIKADLVSFRLLIEVAAVNSYCYVFRRLPLGVNFCVLLNIEVLYSAR